MSETATAPASAEPSDIVVRADEAAEVLQDVKTAIGKVIYGQADVVEQALTTVLAGGHGLLVGVPGLAKTKLVDTMSIVLGLDARRIQFTPDLMPSDILGSEVLEQGNDGSRNFTSPSPESGLICRRRFTYWQPRTRWSRKAPIRCRRHSLTGF